MTKPPGFFLLTLKGHPLSFCVWSYPAIGREELTDCGEQIRDWWIHMGQERTDVFSTPFNSIEAMEGGRADGRFQGGPRQLKISHEC